MRAAPHGSFSSPPLKHKEPSVSQVPVLESSHCLWKWNHNYRAAKAARNSRPVRPHALPSLPLSPRAPKNPKQRSKVASCSAQRGCRGSLGNVQQGRSAPATDMAAERGNAHDGHEDASGADLYAVLGLKKECTDDELRVAYRRLAMIWHPDRCSASGSSARVQEAKERFQEIQGAYTVLSDSNKRLLYDVGVYDSEDAEDELSDMADFLGEMSDMMSQVTPTETFEELQQLFVDMFQDDIMSGICGGPRPGYQRAQSQFTSVPPRRQQPSSSQPRPPSAGTNTRAPPSCNGFGKRGSSAMGSGKPSSMPGRAGFSPGLGLAGFCFKVTETRQRPAPRTHGTNGGEGRSGRKQRPSMSRDVSDDFSRQSRAPWE